jgi:hypothetical protein
MRTSCIIGFILLLAGCTATVQRSAGLTAEQAQALAVQLASDKASALYHCQPFKSGEPARFVKGHWVWVGLQGYGQGDIQATVELAADGATNSVDFKLLLDGVSIKWMPGPGILESFSPCQKRPLLRPPI